ncbi:MAG TPA: cardiolipin synthase [Roseiflexaceae bacterium]|nr:cardiolipin synthase [Roseiflexaceae bacterium]
MNWANIAWVVYLLQWVLFIVALFIVPPNRKPGEATAWLMLIFLIPFLGFLLYLLLGSPKLSKQRRAMQGTMSETLTKATATLKQNPEMASVAALLDPPIPERYQPIVCLNHQLGSMNAFGGNSVELLPDYQGAVDRIIQDIDNAQKYVHVEYFMFADDTTGGPMIDALIRAQERGVKCRVLIDDLGDTQFKKPVVTRLRAGNVETHLMLPVIIVGKDWTRLDLRNHRKIVVVDGQIGFTGSQNIIDRNYHKGANIKKGLYYIELVARVTGPIVGQLDAAFRTDWYSETKVVLSRETAPEVAFTPVKTGDVLCQVLPSGPGFDTENNLKLFVALFHAARQTITIANPYFVPDESLMVAITSAAQRGVEVTLIVSEVGDQFLVYHAQRSFYEELLRAGVKIHRYKSPVLLHSKHLSIDDDIAVIGSSNMDMRSFQLDLEVTLICYDKGVVSDMQAIFADYLRHSAPLRLNEWETRPSRAKFFDNLARLTSSLQ